MGSAHRWVTIHEKVLIHGKPSVPKIQNKNSDHWKGKNMRYLLFYFHFLYYVYKEYITLMPINCELHKDNTSHTCITNTSYRWQTIRVIASLDNAFCCLCCLSVDRNCLYWLLTVRSTNTVRVSTVKSWYCPITTLLKLCVRNSLKQPEHIKKLEWYMSFKD